MFTVQLATRHNEPIVTSLRVAPVRYSWAAVGGPDTAELRASGRGSLWEVFGWLGCRIMVRNGHGVPVWWGLLTEATVVADGVEYGVSLDDVANRIAVLYTDGVGRAGQTPWAEDARSVDRYGPRALLYSLGRARTEQAAAALTALLAARATPQPVVRTTPGGAPEARLRGVGLWRTLDWLYWRQNAGYLALAGEDEGEALLGWGVLASQVVGFDGRARRIAQGEALLGGLRVDDRFVVSGSAANDGTYTVTAKSHGRGLVAYTAGTISFDPSDDMHDNADRLDQFAAPELVEVTGSPANRGFYFTKSVSPDHMTMHPATVVEESAGAVITVRQGDSVAVAEPVTTELPQPGVKYVTLTAHGLKVAQSFVVPTGQGCTVGEVLLRLRHVNSLGGPSDAVRVEVCANAGGAPGAVLDAALVAGSVIPANLTSVQFALNRTAQLTGGGVYWLVVSRTGSAHALDYYLVAVDAGARYTDGVLRLWTGSAWAARTPDADLWCEVWGHRETTAQLADIVAAAPELAGASVRVASGVFTHQYADGRRTAADEVDRLLATGTADGRRLLVTVTPDGEVVVDAAPDPAAPTLRLAAGGRLANRYGKDLPPGALPVGQWVALPAPELGGLAPFGPAFLERAEYDAAGGQVRPEFGRESAWEIGKARQG